MAASPGFGDSGTAPDTPRCSHARTDGGTASCAATPETIRQASPKVDGSATVGPEPITLGSSSTGAITSEMASVRVSPRHAAASRPPLMRDRCLRTQFSSSMARPSCMSARVICCFSARVTPSTGPHSSADAPPESSTMRRPSAGTACAAASAASAAATLSAVGVGCPPVYHSTSSGTRCPSCVPTPMARSGSSGTSAYQRSSMAAEALPAATSE